MTCGTHDHSKDTNGVKSPILCAISLMEDSSLARVKFGDNTWEEKMVMSSSSNSKCTLQ